jgi:hypothetical protein
MPLTRQSIEELKAIHKERFREELSDDEAWEMGRRLLRLFAVLMEIPDTDKQAGEKFEPPPV